MADITAAQVVDELRLTPEQMLTLYALQARMMLDDVNAESKAKTAVRKRRYLYAVVRQTFDEIVHPYLDEPWMPAPLVQKTPPVPHLRVDLLVSQAAPLALRVTDRAAAVIILAELMTSAPYGDDLAWEKKSRNISLTSAAAELGGLRPDDLSTMTSEYSDLMRAIRRKSIKWGRVAVVGVVAAGAGVATMGAAAPAIGAVIGGAMGLSGAAAASAGLAALGGGSLAAGGFGVAGGTALLSGLGGALAGSVAAVGARFSPLASQKISAEAIKLDLVARMVLANSTNQDEKMRRVVESLQEVINNVSERTSLLVAKIEELKQQKAATDADNTRLREEIKAMKAEVAGMRAASVTLEVVRGRLPELSAA